LTANVSYNEGAYFTAFAVMLTSTGEWGFKAKARTEDVQLILLISAKYYSQATNAASARFT